MVGGLIPEGGVVPEDQHASALSEELADRIDVLGGVGAWRARGLEDEEVRVAQVVLVERPPVHHIAATSGLDVLTAEASIEVEAEVMGYVGHGMDRIRLGRLAQGQGRRQYEGGHVGITEPRLAPSHGGGKPDHGDEVAGYREQRRKGVPAADATSASAMIERRGVRHEHTQHT